MTFLQQMQLGNRCRTTELSGYSPVHARIEIHQQAVLDQEVFLEGDSILTEASPKSSAAEGSPRQSNEHRPLIIAHAPPPFTSHQSRATSHFPHARDKMDAFRPTAIAQRASRRQAELLH